MIKIIKKILGIIFLIISFFIAIVGIYGFFDMEMDISTKIAVELIILFVFLIPFLIGIKLLFNYSIFKKKTKSIEKNTENNIIESKPNKIKMPKVKSIDTYIVETPFYGFKVQENESNEEWKYFSGEEVYKWLSKEDIDGINWSWNNDNMVEYISNLNLKKKLSSINLYINKNGTCRFFVKVIEELNDEEKNQIINFISGQVSDGWGEGDFSYEDSNGETFELSFWKNDNSWYIKYIEDELFEEFINIYKTKTKKDCYKVDLVDSIPNIMDNKIGGNPYLPVNEEYPLDKNGNPMLLLLQINLKDIELDGYPKDGILEIFIDQECSWPCDYKVKYFIDNQEYKNDFPELKSENKFLKGSYKIKLSKIVDYMNISDFRYYDVYKEIISIVYGVNADEYDVGFDEYKHNYSKKFDTKHSSSGSSICIGGYAAFNQEDPRSYNDMTDKTECILKFDSLYDPKKIYMGDGGILFALISKEEIKNKKFEETFVDWDCM